MQCMQQVKCTNIEYDHSKNIFCSTLSWFYQVKQFFNIMQKYYQLPSLGTLEMSSHFHQT